MIDQQPSGGGRRQFMTEFVRRTIAPVVDFVETRIQRMGVRGAGESTRWLRPPGAIAEPHFSQTCQRCGACVESCPADAIFSLNASAGKSEGTPVIDPDRAACVVCDGLLCTQACPSGALMPLSSIAQIQMGTAEVYAPLCVRASGELCTLCVEQCPIGESALRFDDDGPPIVGREACVGCGVCQLSCPTTPKAIVVKSASAF